MSFLTAIRDAIFSAPDLNIAAEAPAAAAEPILPAMQVTTPAPIPVATHPAAAADLSAGRFATIAKSSELADSPKRLRAALQLVELTPEMSAEEIIAWTLAHVPSSDAPARTIPTLFERAEAAQEEADALGTSPDKIQRSWESAIDEAHRQHKIH